MNAKCTSVYNGNSRNENWECQQATSSKVAELRALQKNEKPKSKPKPYCSAGLVRSQSMRVMPGENVRFFIFRLPMKKSPPFRGANKFPPPSMASRKLPWELNWTDRAKWRKKKRRVKSGAEEEHTECFADWVRLKDA